MSIGVTPPSPPVMPFKNRRGWILAFGIVEILIGCLLLLIIAGTGIVIHNVPAPPNSPAPDSRFMVIGAIFYACIALLFVIVGVGTVQLRRWARIAMLVIGWAWLAMGVFAVIIMALIVPMVLRDAQTQATRPMPAGMESVLRVVMFGMVGVFFVLLPLAFVLFFSRKNVKATFEDAAGAPAPGVHKPVAVIIATAWFALGALGYVFVLLRPGLPLMGVVLTGWRAVAAAAVMEALTLWLAVSLYRQRALGWKIAIAWLVFGWVSTLLTVRRLGMSGMYRAMGYTETELTGLLPFVKYALGAGVALTVVFVVFLLATRKHYLEEAKNGL